MATLVQKSPIYDSVASVSTPGYANQLAVSGTSGTLTFVTVEPSSALVVSSGGFVSTTGLLLPGIYTIGGTVTDTGGDSGTWSFQLTVTGLPLPQVSVTPQVPAMPSSVEMALPFKVDSATGSIAVLTDYVAILAQHIITICLTTPGERLMLPSYGGGIADFVFEPATNLVAGVLAHDLQAALGSWEPAVVINSVSAVPGTSAPNTVSVTVQFSVAPSTDVNQITLAVGGLTTQIIAS